eukprot:TRINITY_DN56080_c0_g1_i4.p1 TRINITY_DN56080_c0_g1~~TRINITY_DN56080_c0_g1_i4.p1  ORF type:complete len:147 (+),score=40.60 TRINITY_DN56080_c0_g1_i4:36-476(+)
MVLLFIVVDIDIFFFFFKQKTAYEMQRGLVGSEMCIRDRILLMEEIIARLIPDRAKQITIQIEPKSEASHLYFEISGTTGAIQIKGSNTLSTACGLKHYLRHVCKCAISWHGDQLALPDLLPAPTCLLYTSPSPRDLSTSRMPSSA